MGFQLLEIFENGEWIYEYKVSKLVDHICHNLNSDYCLSYRYYEKCYNYCNKLRIVLNWKKERGLELRSKKGEMICYKTNDFIDFISDKTHLGCCGSV